MKTRKLYGRERRVSLPPPSEVRAQMVVGMQGALSRLQWRCVNSTEGKGLPTSSLMNYN